MMKIFKIISFAVIALMSLTFSAYAENSFSFYENISVNGSEFVVEGSAEKEINILILKPDMAVTDKVAVQYAENIIPNENGVFSVAVPMDVENDASGNYVCYIGGEGFNGVSENKSLYFASEAERKTAISNVKNADDIAKALDDNKDMLSVNNELVNGVGFDKLAVLIAENKAVLNADNYIETIRQIQQMALVAAYNNGRTDLVINNNEFLYQSLIDFSELDDNGASIYAAYKNILNDNGKAQVIKNLCYNNLKTEKELLTKFAEQVILAGIKNANTDGSGHIEKLITKKNTEAAELDDNGYLSLTTSVAKTTANNYIVKGNFTNIAELEQVIKNAVKAASSTNVQGTTGGGNGGGGNSASKNNGVGNIIIGNNNITQDSAELNQATNNDVFNDIENVAWAKEAILDLYKKGVINGVGDNKFAPQSNVTREQFVVIIMRAFGINASSDKKYFADAEPGAYYEAYINTAKELGIVNGIDENNFGVGKALTRQDLTVMVKNVIDVQGLTPEKIRTVVFGDEAEIADYAKGAVAELSEMGIINGFEDNTFRPKENCTRAQAAKIIYELMKGSGR